MAIPLRTRAADPSAPDAASISSYRAYAVPAGVESIAECSWEAEPGWRRRIRLLPDACVDVVWDGRALVVQGPATRALYGSLATPRPVIGVRLRAGSALRVLGRPATAIRDRRLPLSELLGTSTRELERALATAPDLERGRHLLIELVAGLEDPRRGRWSSASDAVELLRSPSATVASVANALGVSERRLHRDCAASVGYGPKTLQRILRFGAFLERLPALATERRWAAATALELGYADQAHFCRETRRICGSTPLELAAAWRRAAPPIRSIPDPPSGLR
ncbi:MAG TPA: helix-turn-helix domain-containing protein [Pseudomonadales bacterium]